MSQQDLEAFRASVGQNRELLGELRDETDRVAFVARLVALAETAGYRITADEIESVMRENYLLWLQRWA